MFFCIVDPSLAFIQNLQQQMGAESQLQSLPPAVQKAIFLHLTQTQTQGNEPQRAEAQDDNSNRGKHSSAKSRFAQSKMKR